MDKTKIRIILILVILLGFSVASFGVLYQEQVKKRAQFEKDRRETLARIEDISKARDEYYKNIAEQKANLSKQMAGSKAQYEELLAKQPEAVAASQQTVTKTVQKTVPVVTTQTVKPKSTSTTKKS